MTSTADLVKPVSSSTRTPQILFSTTRAWNPGPDFTLMGIENLLKPILGTYNPVIYNRNPDLHVFRLKFDRLSELKYEDTVVKTNFYQLFKPYFCHYDNSLREDLSNPKFDLAIFAGTPEWLGPMVAPLVDMLHEQKTPVAFIGIGSQEGTKDFTLDKLSPKLRDLVERAELIVTRDKACQRIISPVESILLPCPTLFSCTRAKERKQKKKLALSMQGTKKDNGNRIEEHVWEFCLKLFPLLAEQYDCQLVCHYINDLDELRPVFGEMMDIRYSYEPRDYIEIYNEFDLTVTTRLCGAGLCASLGIPSIIIENSQHCEGASGFLSEMINPKESVDKAFKQVKQFNVAKVSKLLMQHKTRSKRAYTSVLKYLLSNVNL